MSKKKEIENRIKETSQALSHRSDPGKVMDIKLNIQGMLPKYIKGYLHPTKNEVLSIAISDDNITYYKVNLAWNRLFEFVYKHHSGNDIENSTVWELKDINEFSHFVNEVSGTIIKL